MMKTEIFSSKIKIKTLVLTFTTFVQNSTGALVREIRQEKERNCNKSESKK